VKKLVPPTTVNEMNKDAFIQASAGLYEKLGQQVVGGRELISVIALR